MNVKIEFELRVPTVPNFIMIEDKKPGRKQDGWKEGLKVSIAELTDEQLESLGKIWTMALLQRARDIRAKPELLESTDASKKEWLPA